MGDDVERTQFWGSCIVLVVEGSQAGGVELTMQDAFLFAGVEGGGFLATSQGGKANFSMQSCMVSTEKEEVGVVWVQK